MPASIHPLGADPLALVRDELLALDPGSLRVLGADISVAAQIVLGTAYRLPKYRAELVRLVGEEMTRPVDRLELVAHAAMQADALHRAFGANDGLDFLVARVVGRRELLRAEVRLLVVRDVLPSATLDGLSRGRGFRNVAFDVLRLVATLRAVAEQTSLSTADLDEAERLAGTLMTELGVRSHGARTPSADMRLRAYTLMVSTYDHVRRLISFLRWNEGDADVIAPSLFDGRNSRRRAGRNASGEVPTTAASEDAAQGAQRP